MTDGSQHVLDQEDEEAAELLAELGMPRNVARGLVYLTHVDEALSHEIEHGAGLRQPEVSTAMIELRDRGWVAKRNVRTKGKGRSRHSYRLTVPLEDVLSHLEERTRRRFQERRDAVEHARQLTLPEHAVQMHDDEARREDASTP